MLNNLLQKTRRVYTQKKNKMKLEKQTENVIKEKLRKEGAYHNMKMIKLTCDNCAKTFDVFSMEYAACPHCGHKNIDE